MSRSLRASEYRQDALSGDWVVVSPERSGRPDEFREVPLPRREGPCPFCAGNEPETPPAVATYPPGGKPWQVRVVPNKFPAVEDTSAGRSEPCASPEGLFVSRPGIGEVQVIIEASEHLVSVTELPDATLDSMIQAYRDRLSTLAAGGRWQYAQVFKNVGAAAGSSIEHAHSQLVALPYIPRRISTELERSACYYNRYGKHLLAELVEQELAAGERVVATTSDFIAVCPFASRFPYETWILPRRRQARFEAMAAGPAKEFARLLRDVIARLERTLGRPAYNYLLHTAPLDGSGDEHYHWHVELFPRITKAAGFEWATGYHINPVAPEQAAASLRAA